MSERWLPVPGFEGLYEVSDEGRVRCLPRHRVRGGVLRPSVAGKGYLKVQLVHKQRHEHRYVHELVLTTFVGQRPPGMEVAHGNGKRDDNRLANLRWDTRSGNFADKAKHGTATVGERHGRGKLSAAEAIAVREATGPRAEIAARYGIGLVQVYRIKARKNWSHL